MVIAWCVFQIYKKFKTFSAMFSVLSTNKDKKGKEFISTFEGIPDSYLLDFSIYETSAYQA